MLAIQLAMLLITKTQSTELAQRERVRMDLLVLFDTRNWSTYQKESKLAVLQLARMFEISESSTRVGLIFSTGRGIGVLNLTANVSELLVIVATETPGTDSTDQRASPETSTEVDRMFRNNGRPEAAKVLAIFADSLAGHKSPPDTGQTSESWKSVQQYAYVYVFLRQTNRRDQAAMRFRTLNYYRRIIDDQNRLFFSDWSTSTTIDPTTAGLFRKQLELDLCHQQVRFCRLINDDGNCVGTLLRTSEHWTNCSLQPERLPELCPLSECERECDSRWPWETSSRCDCRVGRRRKGANPYPILLRHCPTVADCTDDDDCGSAKIFATTNAREKRLIRIFTTSAKTTSGAITANKSSKTFLAYMKDWAIPIGCAFAALIAIFIFILLRICKKKPENKSQQKNQAEVELDDATPGASQLTNAADAGKVAAAIVPQPPPQPPPPPYIRQPGMGPLRRPIPSRFSQEFRYGRDDRSVSNMGMSDRDDSEDYDDDDEDDDDSEGSDDSEPSAAIRRRKSRRKSHRKRSNSPGSGRRHKKSSHFPKWKKFFKQRKRDKKRKKKKKKKKKTKTKKKRSSKHRRSKSPRRRTRRR